MIKLPKRTQAGFTLIEVLIAIVVVGLVLTAITAGLTSSVKNAAESRYRARASTLGQEAMEVFAREKTLLGWGEFFAFFPNGTTIYCLRTTPSAGALKTITSGSCGPTQTIDEAGVSFTRQAEVFKAGPLAPEVTVTLTVKWLDGNRLADVTLVRVFRKTD